MENQTKVDFTSQIENLEGTISVWEQRILYKRNLMTGQISCTVTDFEDLIDYDVKITERGINHEGMSYRVLCTKKSKPNHWIELCLCKGYMKSGQAFVEPYNFSNDPTFEYGDISEAVEQWAQDNLWK